MNSFNYRFTTGRGEEVPTDEEVPAVPTDEKVMRLSKKQKNRNRKKRIRKKTKKAAARRERDAVATAQNRALRLLEEEREQIARERDAERRADRNRETREEARLVRFAVPPAVADGIEGRGNPEPRGHQRVEHAQGFHLEGQRHTRQHLEHGESRACPVHHRSD